MTSLSRRDFIKKMMRWGLTGLLSCSGLYLLTRSTTEDNHSIEEDHQCVQTSSSCRNCSKVTSCVLPQALSFRKLFKKQ